MEEGEDLDQDLNGEKVTIRGSKRKGKKYLSPTDRRNRESSDRVESGESDYHSAAEDLSTGNGHDDDPAGETLQPYHNTLAVPGEHQIPRPGRRTKLPELPPAEKLLGLWKMQDSELKVLRAVNRDLQEARESDLIRHDTIQDELSKVMKVMNSLDRENVQLKRTLEECGREYRNLKEFDEGLRQRMYEFAAEANKGKKELNELAEITDGLRRELNIAKNQLKAREQTTEALTAEIQRYSGNELRIQTLEAEAKKLKDELMKERAQMSKLGAQQWDLATEIRETPTTKFKSEKTLASLDNEMWDTESVDFGDEDGEPGHILDYVAYSTKETQTSGPVVNVDKTGKDTHTQKPEVEVSMASTGTQRVNSPSAEGKKSPEESVDNSMSIQTGDASTPDAENRACKSAGSPMSPNLFETSPGQSDLTRLERHQGEPMPSTSNDSTGLTMLPRSRNITLYVEPPAPRTDSTVIDSEPSPLSLNGRLNSCHGKDRPSQDLLSSISEAGTSDLDPFRTDSQPPRFAENSPESTGSRVVGPLGSPTQIPGTPMSGTNHFESNSWPAMQSVKISDISKRRRRTSLRGWSEFRPGEFRPLTASLNILHPNVSNFMRQETSKVFGVQGTQPETSEGESKPGKRQSSVARTIQYTSIGWWLVLLCLAISWWFNQDEKQLWMQANEVTRQTVLGLRDERWAEPSWLTRMSFDAENILEIDRSMFG